MKKLFSLICISSMLLMITACGQSSQTDSQPGGQSSESSVTQSARMPESEQPDTSQTAEEDKAAQITGSEDGSDILVAYFSATGTTKTLAGYVADVTGADLYEIVPNEPYTSDDLNYNDDNSRSSKEQNDKTARPVVSGSVENMEQYDTIFLGYPIWWGDAPRIVYTFMESYDLSGKTIVPFCTSGGSGVGSSANNLHDVAASDITWREGELLDSGISHEEMVSWINGLGLDVTAQ